MGALVRLLELGSVARGRIRVRVRVENLFPLKHPQKVGWVVG